MKTDLTEHRS